MRCPISLCPGTETKRINRTLELTYGEDGKIVGASIRDLWLCLTCGNAFRPGVMRSPKWHLPWNRVRPRRKYLRGPDGEYLRGRDGKKMIGIGSGVKGGRIPKTWIVEELFRDD